MTPEEKSNELIEKFLDDKTIGLILEEEEAKKCALILVEETIDALSSIKGMGKIHKVKFWKQVKAILENE